MGPRAGSSGRAVRSRSTRSGEAGFSLLEVMTVMTIIVVLTGLGAFAIRHFWLVRSLSGGQDEVVSRLRSLQESSVAESHPIVYGAFFFEGEDDIPRWGEVRFNPDDATCVATPAELDAGVYLADVDTGASLPGLSPTEFGEMVTACDAGVEEAYVTDGFGDPGAADGYFFYLARGVANSGSLLLEQPILGRTAGVTVVGLTGRVSKT